MDQKTIEQNLMKQQIAASSTPTGVFKMRIGSITYVGCVHFNQTSTDTLENKVKRLIMEKAKAGNFLLRFQ